MLVVLPLLKDVKYIKDHKNYTTITGIQCYQHDNWSIGTASIAFVDNADEVLQGVVTFSINKPARKYAYNIVKIVKGSLQEAMILMLYILPSPRHDKDEGWKLRAKTFYEDGIMYYKIKLKDLKKI